MAICIIQFSLYVSPHTGKFALLALTLNLVPLLSFFGSVSGTVQKFYGPQTGNLPVLVLSHVCSGIDTVPYCCRHLTMSLPVLHCACSGTAGAISGTELCQLQYGHM
jgi:hypothetical protein